MAYSRHEYENEPVHYCTTCLSLNIKELPGVQFDICGECGNTDIQTADMDDWNHLYAEEYGSIFLTDEEVDFNDIEEE
jgi:hypothetical protein